jgi:hypothetical protein
MMTRILLVQGAFNEFMGPHELKARWLPALRDGLWHHDVAISDADVGVCFYLDLFRREHSAEAEQQFEKSRAGIAESLANLSGSNLIAPLGQAASEAAFDRIVDMVTIMATKPGLRARMRARAEAMVDEDTRVIDSHSLGTLFPYMALCHHPHWRVRTFVTHGWFSARIADDFRTPRSARNRRKGSVAGIGQTVGERPCDRRQSRGRYTPVEVRPQS